MFTEQALLFFTMNSTCVVITTEDEVGVRGFTCNYLGRTVGHLDIILDDDLFTKMCEVVKVEREMTAGEARVADWFRRLQQEFGSIGRERLRGFATEMRNRLEFDNFIDLNDISMDDTQTDWLADAPYSASHRPTSLPSWGLPILSRLNPWTFMACTLTS
jgi:hypothetical protein